MATKANFTSGRPLASYLFILPIQWITWKARNQLAKLCQESITKHHSDKEKPNLLLLPTHT